MPNSVEKTMIILKALSDGHGKPITLASLCESTGINKSTISHILKALCSCGYVYRVSHTKGYLPGPELFMLTRYGTYESELTDVCRHILKWLNAKTGATSLLAVLRGDKKYIIDYVEGDLLYKDSGASILNDDLYRTITGRVLLASLPRDKAIEIFRTLGKPKVGEWDEACDEESFIRELKRLNMRKVNVALGKYGDAVVYSFASPITVSRKCVGAIGLAVVKELDDTEIERLSSLVLKCACEAQRRLAFSSK